MFDGLPTRWTNQTVSLNRIEKAGIPVLDNANLRKDPSDSSFYIYNEEISYISHDILPPTNQLWRFIASESAGKWSNPGVSPAATSDFAGLVRVVGAASALKTVSIVRLAAFKTGERHPEVRFTKMVESLTLQGQLAVWWLAIWLLHRGRILQRFIHQSGSFSRGEL